MSSGVRRLAGWRRSRLGRLAGWRVERLFVELIGAVVDGQRGGAAYTDFGFAAVDLRQPEVAYPGAAEVDLRAQNPERGIFGRLRFDLRYGKIRCIDPDLAAVQELAGLEWFDLEDVGGTAIEGLVAGEFELVVCGRQGVGIFLLRGLLFTVDRLLQNLFASSRRAARSSFAKRFPNPLYSA